MCVCVRPPSSHVEHFPKCYTKPKRFALPSPGHGCRSPAPSQSPLGASSGPGSQRSAGELLRAVASRSARGRCGGASSVEADSAAGFRRRRKAPPRAEPQGGRSKASPPSLLDAGVATASLSLGRRSLEPPPPGSTTAQPQRRPRPARPTGAPRPWKDGGVRASGAEGAATAGRSRRRPRVPAAAAQVNEPHPIRPHPPHARAALESRRGAGLWQGHLAGGGRAPSAPAGGALAGRPLAGLERDEFCARPRGKCAAFGRALGAALDPLGRARGPSSSETAFLSARLVVTLRGVILDAFVIYTVAGNYLVVVKTA